MATGRLLPDQKQCWPVKRGILPLWTKWRTLLLPGVPGFLHRQDRSTTVLVHDSNRTIEQPKSLLTATLLTVTSSSHAMSCLGAVPLQESGYSCWQQKVYRPSPCAASTCQLTTPHANSMSTAARCTP